MSKFFKREIDKTILASELGALQSLLNLGNQRNVFCSMWKCSSTQADVKR